MRLNADHAQGTPEATSCVLDQGCTWLHTCVFYVSGICGPQASPYKDFCDSLGMLVKVEAIF